MIDALRGETAFFTLGVMLPCLMVLVTVAWLAYRGFFQIGGPGPKRASADRERKADG
jgi:hypothetical protein